MQMETLLGEVVEGLSFADYQQHGGINASLLKVAHSQSMAHVKHMLDAKESKKGDELDFGRSFHALFLEGKKEYAVAPDSYTNSKGEEKPWAWQSKTCQKWRDDQTLPVLNKKEVSALNSMVHAAGLEVGFPVADEVEISVFAERKGIALKARIDWLRDDAVIDLKTAESAKPEEFIKKCYQYGYFLQAAFYIDLLKMVGIDRKKFLLVAVEKEPPFATCTITLADDDTGLSLLNLGRKQYQSAFAKIRHAMETNSWPGYGRTDAEIIAPAWMMKEMEALTA